jgi:N-acetylmuramoyl-L-alanine amidase
VRARLAHLGLLDQPVSLVEATSFDESLEAAVRTFQQERGLSVDGIVGADTYRRLDQARWQLGDRVLHFVPGHLMAGDDIVDLQRRLSDLGFDSGRADGLFGPRTDAALRDFQRSVGVQPDGTCGPMTFRAFERLVRTISGGSAAHLRDRVTLASLRTGIAEKVVVIDPAPGPAFGVCGPIAERLEGRLAALGTQVLLTMPQSRRKESPAGAQAGRVADDSTDEPHRADLANRTGADLFVSIDCDHAASPRPQGLATFYYGDPQGGGHSLSGQLLADLIQDELCARTGFLDLRTHARSWDVLRLTRMPAVRVVLGYLSNRDDAKRLTDSQTQDQIAGALAGALRRFCQPTG